MSERSFSIKKDITVYLFLSIFIFSGCSIQKRHYSRGFSLEWGGNIPKERKEGIKTGKISSPPKQAKESTMTASSESRVDPQYGSNFKINKEVTADDKDTCDIIELKDKTRIKAKVTEINLYYVVYKKCNDPDGPYLSIPKSKVSKITFAGGMLQSFDFSVENTEAEPEQDTIYVEEDAEPVSYKKKEFPLANHALIAGGCSYIPVVGWIFAIIAITFGAISLSKIRSNPEKYTGEGKARSGLIMGIIGLIAGFIIALITLYE